MVGQVSQFIDLITCEKKFCANPLDVPEDMPPIPARARRDTVLTDSLAIGMGFGDSSERATNIAQRVKSWEMFTPVAKRQKTIDVRDANASIVLRYIQAQENYFPRVRQLSVSTDGVRVSTKDVQYLCFGGKAEGGDKHRAAWDIKAM